VKQKTYIQLDSSSLQHGVRWRWKPTEPLATLRCDDTSQITTLSGLNITARRWNDPLDALEWMSESVSDFGAEARWIGFLSYDLGRLFERIPSRTQNDLKLPLFIFTLHKPSNAIEVAKQNERRSGSTAIGHRRSTSQNRSLRDCRDIPLQSNFSRPQYERAVQRAIDYIGAGDIFQVNLSQRFSVGVRQSPAEIYGCLCQQSPAVYGALLEYHDFALVSNSPELFLRVRRQSDGSKNIVTRPIKGTRPKGIGMDMELRDSVKDQAELNMIVDLERNDLGRVCHTGSVKVSQPRTVEAHPTVYHGVATVEGALRDDVSFVDLLRATFPGGSITGAPKIRAMQIIEELEPARRGPYCGAIGYLTADGELEFNIAIRTMVLQNGLAYISAGGGIVADSNPSDEYTETLVKAQAMFRVLGIENFSQ
jgi:para-aminobenzoate synthetase component I